MFLIDIFEQDETPEDPRAKMLLKRARVAYPWAKDDGEAIDMYIASKETQDFTQVEQENDQEERMIQKIADVEKTLDQEVHQLQTQVNALARKISQSNGIASRQNGLAHESKVDEVYVSAKEKKRNPNVKVKKLVAIKDPRSQHTLTFGRFMRIGPSGLAHVELNAPLKDDGIVPQHLVGTKHVAVPPSWLFSTVGDAWPADKKSTTKEPKQGELKLK